MRISDWSSDVCSSDLLHPVIDEAEDVLAVAVEIDLAVEVRRVLADKPVRFIEVVTDRERAAAGAQHDDRYRRVGSRGAEHRAQFGELRRRHRVELGWPVQRDREVAIGAFAAQRPAIGRASCSDRVCQSVYVSVVAGCLYKINTIIDLTNQCKA